MGTYAQQIATARRLIAAKGEPATLRLFPAPTAGAQPWKPAGPAPTDQEGVNMAFFPYGQRPSRTYNDGSESKSGDKHVLIAAEGLTEPPRLGAHLIRPTLNETWVVKSLSCLDVGGEAILYELFAAQ